ncbi:MAG TPA: hypothetical protein VF818_09540 [Ktedonobacterales bacterium]
MTVVEARATAEMPMAATERAAGAVWHPWVRRIAIAGLAALYMFIWALSGLLNINPTDLDAFFLPSVRIALGGQPLHVYALRYATLYPNANGPLSLVPLTAVAALAQRLGWLDDVYLRRMLVMAVFSIFTLFMAWEGVAAVQRLRGASLHPLWRGLSFAVFALCPTLWHGILLYGHIELPIAIWMMLLGVRMVAEGRPGRAGVCLGLAILTRSNAVLYLIPLLVLLFARRRWKPGFWLGGSAAATVGAGLLPFYLASPSDLLFSLVTFRGALPVGGGSIWGLTVGTAYESVAQRFDSVFVLGSALVISVVIVVVRRDLTPDSRNVYALLALSGIMFPLFIKTLWPYYFLDLYVLLAVWWLGQVATWYSARRWLEALLPAFFVGCALIAEYGVSLSSYAVEKTQENLAMTVLLMGFVLALGGWLVLRAPRSMRPLAV